MDDESELEINLSDEEDEEDTKPEETAAIPDGMGDDDDPTPVVLEPHPTEEAAADEHTRAHEDSSAEAGGEGTNGGSGGDAADVVDAMESDTLEIELSESEPGTPADPPPDDTHSGASTAPVSAQQSALSASIIPRKGGMIPRKGETARLQVVVEDSESLKAKP